VEVPLGLEAEFRAQLEELKSAERAVTDFEVLISVCDHLVYTVYNVQYTVVV
jgi:hypothetical protein